MFSCPVSGHVISVQGLERTQLALNYVSGLGEAVVLAQMQLKVEIVLDFGYCLGAGIQRTRVEVLTICVEVICQFLRAINVL
jgi:hypothetical protein